MELLILKESLRLLDAAKEIVPLLVVYGLIQMQSIKGRLIKVEVMLEK